MCRVVGWLWRPITSSYLPEPLFMSLSYYIPEIIPSIVSLVMIQYRLIQQKRHKDFLSTLYHTDGDDYDDDYDPEYEPHRINSPTDEDPVYRSGGNSFSSDSSFVL